MLDLRLDRRRAPRLDALCSRFGQPAKLAGPHRDLSIHLRVPVFLALAYTLIAGFALHPQVAQVRVRRLVGPRARSAAVPRRVLPTPLRRTGHPRRGRRGCRTTARGASAASVHVGTLGDRARVWDRWPRSAPPAGATESARRSCRGTSRAASDGSSSRAKVRRRSPVLSLAHHAVTVSPTMPESSRSDLP